MTYQERLWMRCPDCEALLRLEINVLKSSKKVSELDYEFCPICGSNQASWLERRKYDEVSLRRMRVEGEQFLSPE